MSLSSTSTYAEIKAAFVNNASYRSDSTGAKCDAFIEACEILSAMPARMRIGAASGAGQEIEFDAEVLQKKIELAEQWRAANVHPTAGRTTYGDFSSFRD